MKSVAYIRVSTLKEEQDLSLEHQREFFEKYIVHTKGDDLVEIYSDKGKSATKMQNRKDLQRMLRDAKAKKFEKLYVKDISRLFRNTIDFITTMRNLRTYGIKVHILNMDTGQDIDDFTLNLMAMVAENESQKISERVKFGKKFSKEQGIVPNFVFGYERIDKFTLKPHPTESVWVKKIFDLYTEELWGMARIAEYLFQNKVYTKKKKDGEPNYNWSQNTVGNILENEIYIGKVINGKETTQNIYTNKRNKHSEEEWYVSERPEFRLISDEQFEKAKNIREINAEMFAQNLQGQTGTRRSEKHLFSNLIRCNSCGFAYRRTQKQYSENRPMKVWWTCSKRSAYGKNRCVSQYIRIEEEWLKTALDALFDYLIQDKEEFLKLIESKCNAIIHQHIKDTAGFDIVQIQTQLKEYNEQRERAKQLAIKGLISMAEAEKEIIPINKEIEKLEFALNETDNTRALTKRVNERIRSLYKDIEGLKITDEITNLDLKKIIREIRVVSQDEIYVHFNVDKDLEGLSFPVSLSGLVPMPKKNSTTKNSINEAEISDIKANDKIDTNTEHSTQGRNRAS